MDEEAKQKLRETIKKKWVNHQYDKLKGKQLTDEHKKSISEGIAKRWSDPNYRTKNIESQNKYWQNISVRAEYAEMARKRWEEDKQYRETTVKAIRENASLPAYKEIMKAHGVRRSKEIGEMLKALWQDPEWRKKQINKTIQALARPEIKEKLSNSSKQMWLSESYREKGLLLLEKYRKSPKRIEAVRAVMATAEYRAKLQKALAMRCNNVEFRSKMSEISKRAWEDPKFRDRMAVARLSQKNKTSSQQITLYSLLDDLHIKYYKDNAVECKIGFYIFDCRIDPQEGIELKKPLLIEVQGDYWHNLPKAIKKDQSKATYIKTYFPDFCLKYLWEHEFNNKDRISHLIKYWCGVNEIIPISFNFGDIKERVIDFRTAEIFVGKYHYAGRVGRSGLNIGYFLNDELIAVIIYAAPIRQEVAKKQNVEYKKILELSRMIIHPQYQIKNLASHIISRSILLLRANKPEILKLISFADSTYNHLGTIYKASNWNLDGEVAPDYWYADDRGYICHKKTLWNHANKMGLTELEYCQKYNYMKVFGDKKFRYVYQL